MILSRAVFDRALVDAAISAGAHLIAERVIELKQHGVGFVVRTPSGDYEADYLLGADGANSLVRKTFSKPFRRAQLSVAAGYYVDGVTDAEIVIQSMSDQPGYLWSFPRPDHLAIGICAPAANRATSGDLRARCRHWIEGHGLSWRTSLRPYAWPIPSIADTRDAALAGPRWMLLGDAAGLVDPLTREGIYYALLSGEWAAQALASTPGAASARYQERLRDEVQPELGRAARLLRLFFNPGFSALFVDALHGSAAIRRVFADLVAGRQPYLGLRRRLLGTREWGLAARAIVAFRPEITGKMRAVASPRAT